MSRTNDNPWLHRFAVATALATLVLISIGGLVTSHGAGMAVPDWPTTYGYNMFLFPVSKWVGGIFYEHTHRLVASGVGLLTTVLAVWLWLKENRAWVRWLGVAAFLAVVLQGVLGGMRVTLYKDQLGVLHGTLAQLFLATVCAIALFTSRWWLQPRDSGPAFCVTRTARFFCALATALIFIQLVLGAAMRHQHAGLAIPDFPLAYGKLWPAMDAAMLEKINQQRVDVRDFKPVTAIQIGLQMAHRITAGMILLAVAGVALRMRKELGARTVLSRLALAWLGLILAQIVLGAATIWSNKAADIATAHVVLGALNLVAGSLLTILAFRFARAGEAVARCARDKAACHVASVEDAITVA